MGYAYRIRKLLDLILAKVREVFVFIDDILIVTKGTKDEQSAGNSENTRQGRIAIKGGKM